MAFLSQAMAFVARQSFTLGEPRPEARLEESLERFWSHWSAVSGDGAVIRQASMRSPAWPGVGKVDLEVVEYGDEPGRTWIEVKWHDLWNCVWDAAKLALALEEGLCDRAYLVAAAPAAEWGKPGAEFFATGTWDMGRDVLLRHRSSWLYWKQAVKTRPLRLPAEFSTLAGHSFGITGSGLPGWSLRSAELRRHGGRWIQIDEDRQPIAR